MTDPVTLTASTIVALAASKFVEAAAKQAGDIVAPAALQKASTQVDNLWSRIKQHFAGNQLAEKAIAQVETEQSEAAFDKLKVYLDDELESTENQTLARNLRQLAQQIVNIGQQIQTQKQTTFNVDAKDQARVTAVEEVNANTVNFGDSHP